MCERQSFKEKDKIQRVKKFYISQPARITTYKVSYQVYR